METKKEFKYFTIFNHEDEEKYLRNQHKAGWKLTKVSGIGMYHFEKCEPEDVVYQLDYNKEGSANKDEYTQMFADCGWEYILEFAEYSYFRKNADAMDGEEEIFSDNSSRLAMMERVIKGRLIPVLILFCIGIIPQFVIHMKNANYNLATVWGSILVLYLVMFGFFAKKYFNLKNQ